MSDAPLKPQSFQVLLALAEAPRHGFAIREAVEARTDGGMVLWPATLYGLLRDLSTEGLIEELPPARVDDDDGRRKYYGLTPNGRERLRTEADRLAGWAEAARQGLQTSQG